MQRFLVRFEQERPAQAHHARLLAPVMDQFAVVGVFEREIAHDGEAVRIFPGRLDGELIGIGIPAARRVDQRGIDASLIHLPQDFLGRELCDLAMQAGSGCHGLRPDVNLRVDDLHGIIPSYLRYAIAHGEAKNSPMPNSASRGDAWHRPGMTSSVRREAIQQAVAAGALQVVLRAAAIGAARRMRRVPGL